MSSSDLPPRDKRDQEELVIRFLNTRAWRLRDQAEERLPDTASLAAWLDKNEVAGPALCARLCAPGTQAVQRAVAALKAAHDLREALYAMFLCQIDQKPPPSEALHTVNRMIRATMSRAELEWQAGPLGWAETSATEGVDLLRPVLVSALGLLTGTRRTRVKQCADARGCGWLFVDDSPAGTRRWCSMGDCGNIAKAKRHYRQKHPRSLSEITD